MNALATVPIDTIPAWAGAIVIVMLLLGGGLVLIGSFGLLRLRDFYQRTHAAAVINSLGIGCVVIASLVYFSALGARPVFGELLIVVFVLLTTPVTAMLLIRAAIYRDRRGGRDVRTRPDDTASGP